MKKDCSKDRAGCQSDAVTCRRPIDRSISCRRSRSGSRLESGAIVLPRPPGQPLRTGPKRARPAPLCRHETVAGGGLRSSATALRTFALHRGAAPVVGQRPAYTLTCGSSCRSGAERCCRVSGRPAVRCFSCSSRASQPLIVHHARSLDHPGKYAGRHRGASTRLLDSPRRCCGLDSQGGPGYNYIQNLC